MNQRLKSINQWSKINESMIEVHERMIQIIENLGIKHREMLTTHKRHTVIEYTEI